MARKFKFYLVFQSILDLTCSACVGAVGSVVFDYDTLGLSLEQIVKLLIPLCNVVLDHDVCVGAVNNYAVSQQIIKLILNSDLKNFFNSLKSNGLWIIGELKPKDFVRLCSEVIVEIGKRLIIGRSAYLRANRNRKNPFYHR